MISPELLRRFPFVASLNHQEIVNLAKISKEEKVEAETFFFHEGDQADKVYIVLEGAIAIVFEVPDREEGSAVSEQLTGGLAMREVVISTVGTGDAFGWAGIIPPHETFAGAKAITESTVISIDCVEMRKMFAEDPAFAYHMTMEAAQVMREQLRDLSIEALAFIA